MSEATHVLVVDDDARLRALLQRYLAEQGFRVTTAGHAAAAREQMRSMAPDVLVLDVMMPGETGLSLTAALRATAATVPILLLTARGAPEDRIAGFEAGARRAAVRLRPVSPGIKIGRASCRERV